MAETITITLGDNKRHELWTHRVTTSFDNLAEKMAKSPFGPKDGPCFTPAVFAGESRNLNQSTQIDIAVLDSDCGQKVAGWAEDRSAASGGLANVPFVSLNPIRPDRLLRHLQVELAGAN
jgi:hypothetical protein